MKTRTMRKGVCSALALVNLVPGVARATENGNTSYPIGVNTVLNGLLPAPGTTRFFNYTLHYEADRFAGPDGASTIPAFKAKVAVDALRLVHTWETPIAGVAVSSGAIVPLYHVDLSVPGASGGKNGVGDITLQPLMFNFANASRSFVAYASPFDLAVPNGAYSRKRVANPGANVYAWEPSVYATWFPSPGLEISTMGMIEVHSKNDDTGYRSGAVAMFEYMGGYSLTPTLQLGVQGYVLKQFTDDKLNGERYLDGFRGRVVAVGPQLRYEVLPGVGFVVKFQKEHSARNRPQGRRLWLQFSMAL